MSNTEISVKIKRGDSREIDRAIKKLKRAMDDEGIIQYLKDRRYYEKPCQREKRKRADAKKRRAKERRFNR